MALEVSFTMTKSKSINYLNYLSILYVNAAALYGQEGAPVCYASVIAADLVRLR